MNAHAIEVQSLIREYPKGPRAVDGISLYVEPGEIYGFLGPNGAGKSTTVKMLTTLLPPSGGTAIVGGYDVSQDGPQVRSVMGAALQEAALDPLLTAREHFYLQAGLHGYSHAQAEEKARVLLERVGLTGAADRKAGTFSGGMKRRLDLALSLVHSPRIVFLDEPTTGLDPQSRTALWDEVARLARDEGVTVFLTTQYLEEADALARRVGIIDQGRIVAEGTPADLKAQIGRPTVEIVPDLAEDSARVESVLARFGSLVGGAPNAVAVRLQDARPPLAEIVRALDQAGIGVANLELHAPTLDDVFLAKTGRTLEGVGEEEAEEPGEAPAAELEQPPDVELRMAVAGRSRIERVPTELLKEWMAERRLQSSATVAPGPVTLAVREGPLAGQRIQLDRKLVLGREGVDLVISDPEVSRRHAAVRMIRGSPVIEDLNSLNGTWVNGTRIASPTLLAPGDVLSVGKTTIDILGG